MMGGIQILKKSIIIGILSLFLMQTNVVISENQDLSDNNTTYFPHEPIYINGNNGFTEKNGVTSGEGTKDNPYIIRGWDINCSSKDGIVIKNVYIHFVIKDCYIHDGGDNNDGIVFCKVQFGKIQNNTISKNRNGIKFTPPEIGKGNCESKDNIITDNKIIFNSGRGISFDHIGEDHHKRNMILNNDFEHNYIGIYMIMSDSNKIISNNFILNNGAGIVLNQCIGGGDYNEVYHNNFIYNGDARQVFDIGYINYWNDSYPSGGNYWFDYDGTDIYSGPNQSIMGADGIGDTPYEIRNSSVSWLPSRYDCYPLIKPVRIISLPLPPAKPNIIGKKSGKEKSIFQFNISSIDPNGDNVYYSIDWGDGFVEEWLGPYNSGQVVTLTHAWNNQGNYEIIVKVTDESYEKQEGDMSWSNHSILIFPKYAISKPFSGLYVSNEKVVNLPILKNKSIVIGKIAIIVDVLTEELNIERVEYYINDVFKGTQYREPYVWFWTEIGFSRFNVKTILHSDIGCNASYQITVWKFF